MGLIRKTCSIGTFGIVPFRSKKEKLRRADRARLAAEAALDREQRAREAAEVRIAAAEKRVKHAIAEASRTSHRLEKVKRHRRRRTAALTEALAGAEPIVRSGVQTARSAGGDAAERGRRAGRRARKAATRATAATKEAVAPRAEKVATKIGEAIEHL